jgi:CelD/BcsL family acetyltransferase involved in cellulose biosynthesis
VRKVRQTRTAFEKLGPLTTHAAASSEEAAQLFAEMKELHESRWQAIGGGRGAFTYPMFERFHSMLIARHFSAGCLQLFKVAAGEATVGILYNFVHRGHVLQYQSGLNYALINRNESPGLLTHALSVDYNVAQGMTRYDLLVGDSQYKRSLAPNAYELWWGVVQQDRYKFRAEEWLRRGVRGARAMVNRRTPSPEPREESKVERDAALS